MKAVLFFFCLILLSSLHARCQAPNLSAIQDEKEKAKAWLSWCEELRINQKGMQGNYIQLEQAALQGLQLEASKDAGIRSQFHFDAALGCYYQLKFDSAQYYFYQSLHDAQTSGIAARISRACVALIPVNFQLQQPGKVEECKNILQSIVDTTHDPELLKDGYYALGSYYQQKSYYSTAQDYFIKSLEMREGQVDTTKDAKKKFDYAIQCDMLSKLYLNTQMMDKSLQALRQGWRFAGVSPNVSNRLLSSFVEAFTQSGHIDSALYYNKQLEAATNGGPGFTSEQVSSYLNIAIYYIDHHQYGEAPPYLDKAEVIAKATQSPLLIFQFQMIKGRYLEETGKYDEALVLLNQALPVARQLSLELSTNILKYTAQAQKGKGNTAAALQYYEQYSTQSDSLTKQKLATSFSDQETRYETSRKEQQIASLGKENRLKALELENADHTRILLIVGLIAVGIIALLLYFIYRNKESVNRVLNNQNETLDGLNRQLALANETKARLFGIISHDLRSPVSRIVQLLQVQKENPGLLDEATRQRHEERLRTASENVLETMEDLLLWSKSQMQHFTPQTGTVRLRELVCRELNLLKEPMNQKGVKADLQIPEDCMVETDENFLVVIIRNLLANAIKYSDPGSPVAVAAGAKRISVMNRSATLDATALNTRLSNGRVDSRDSGLGLQIARDLAKSIGAEIRFFQAEGNIVQAVVSWN